MLAGCSFNIKVELPRIQISADRITNWIAAKFNSWAPALVNAVKAENAKIQAMTVAGGWGPLAKEIIGGFIKAAQGILSAASTVAPILGIPLAALKLAGEVIAALSAFSNLAGAGAVPSLDDADKALAELGA